VTFPPALIMIGGAALLPLLPRRSRSTAAIAVPLATLVYLWTLPDGASLTVEAIGLTLEPVSADALARVFGSVFAIVAVAGGIYARHLEDTGQQVAALVYGGGAIGIAFSGDLFSLLFFTELMAVFSTYLIWARRTEEARRAGLRYLLVHLTGGAFLMGGILMHLGRTGSPAVVEMDPAHAASWVVLIGVALNAAIPPLHPWLPDAYPKATITGAVFLSAFTTKSSVYVLVRMFPGWDVLIYLGVAMALYGVVYAVLANDIREILAYHIISQVGYMVAGAGIGTEMALNGAIAHAFSHILYKGLLFMGAGAAIFTTGRSKLTELGGIYRKQRAIFWLYMIGAFSISGFPLFNGFISKSMVVTAAGEAHHVAVMLLLLLASIGTFLHTGLKLPYWTWFGEDRGLEPGRAPRGMYAGMGLAASLCFLFGVAPGLLYRYLPYPVEYHPYNGAHLVETAQILTLTFVAFWLLRRKLAGEAKLALDTDWFYRRPAPALRRLVVAGTGRAFDALDAWGDRAAAAAARLLRNPAPRLQRFLGAPGAEEPDAPFDADDARPALAAALGLIVLAFVVFGIVALA
jgi:multicomponent Na+:H+ antiporter subunit D